MEEMKTLQEFVSKYGLGISKEELVSEAYYALRASGHGVYIINDKYLGINDREFQLIKSKKDGKWIVKEIR